MSARIATASITALRLRRQFDVDAITVWLGVMSVLATASALALFSA